MAINKSSPMRFTPRGLVDAFDATDKFQGACRQLTNLVFDQSNPELLISRPGVTQLANLNDAFTSPGFISIQAAIGTRVYGMVATSRNPGNDEPFCYDTATRAFVPISGVTATNTPASPANFGDWTPPTIANVGTMIIITHPGFPGGGAGTWGGGALWAGGALWGSGVGVKVFGVIDITNPAAPAWNAFNTGINGLPAIPQAVANFNNRAYFAVANQVFYTDELTNPPVITNASQFLVIGDQQPVNALAGLPIQTTSSGVVQALTVFKTTQVWQITGDTAFGNLSLNYMSLNIGANAPRSVAQSPYGLYFSSSGGPYTLDLLGTLRPLTHSLQEIEPDVQAPFENAQTPTRWAAAYNSTVYRVCGPTLIRGSQVTNDYWFDEHKRRWNGPHTFTYDCASAIGGYFVLSSVNNPGLLMQSFTQQNLSFVETDLDSQNSVTLLSSTFPKVGDMFMKQVAESQIELAASGGAITYFITALDEQGNVLGTAQISVTDSGAKWGAFVWGDGTLWTETNKWGGGALWGAVATVWGAGASWGDPVYYTQAPGGSGALWGAGAQDIPHTFPVPWPAPLVFEKMALQITAQASAEVGIGTFYARYQRTGYMTLG